MTDTDSNAAQGSPKTTAKVRIDKWLWAARFFKTRSLAKQAIDGGKIRLDGERAKASKEIDIGARLEIRCGWDEIEVIVTGLSDQRRGAPEARKLYQETENSVNTRSVKAEQRKTLGVIARPDSKPNTKERRQLNKIKREILDDY